MLMQKWGGGGGGGGGGAGANKVHYGKCASGEYRLMTQES